MRALILINQQQDLIQLKSREHDLLHNSGPLRLFAIGGLDSYPARAMAGSGERVGSRGLKTFASERAALPNCDDVIGTTVDEIMSRQVMTVDEKTRLQRGRYRPPNSYYAPP